MNPPNINNRPLPGAAELNPLHAPNGHVSNADQVHQGVPNQTMGGQRSHESLASMGARSPNPIPGMMQRNGPTATRGHHSWRPFGKKRLSHEQFQAHQRKTDEEMRKFHAHIKENEGKVKEMIEQIVKTLPF